LETPEVRTAEIVKAYPVGRYTDPNFQEAMHERHTLYRREQAAEWNYRPSNSYALPLGPVVAESNPSPSYYVKTNAEQMNAQQKAYAEALLEQNRALNQRIQDLQKQDSKVSRKKSSGSKSNAISSRTATLRLPKKPARSPHQKRRKVFPRWMEARCPRRTAYPIRAI
jgi:hypothetical protein